MSLKFPSYGNILYSPSSGHILCITLFWPHSLYFPLLATTIILPTSCQIILYSPFLAISVIFPSSGHIRYIPLFWPHQLYYLLLAMSLKFPSSGHILCITLYWPLPLNSKFINAGVPQGSILGPLLFIIFIDDITLDISSTSILYADDVTVMSFIKSKEERIPAAASLNQDLCNIEKWATSWNVLFGAAKCKTVTISNRQDAKDSHPGLQVFGTTLTETETVELLCLTLSKDLSWKHDVTSMAKSAAQRTGLLRRVAPYLLPTQRAMIYKAIIRSKMEYASSAWFGATPTSLSQLDAVQRRPDH